MSSQARPLSIGITIPRTPRVWVKIYPSLSKVAFAITGSDWNGPRFFGLRDRDTAVKKGSTKPVRCAIYTRVSTDHGLVQDFNSLDAQSQEAPELAVTLHKGPGVFLEFVEAPDQKAAGLAAAKAPRCAVRRPGYR
jgi:hypothetical protein